MNGDQIFDLPSNLLAKYLAIAGLTPSGPPSWSLCVTNKKLLMLIPALNTPVGANWDLMTCQPYFIINFDTNLSSYSHSYPETLNLFYCNWIQKTMLHTHYKIQVNTCMFEACRSKQAAENFTENWFYSNFVICTQSLSLWYKPALHIYWVPASW